MFWIHDYESGICNANRVTNIALISEENILMNILIWLA
jgi:hypothetical protein